MSDMELQRLRIALAENVAKIAELEAQRDDAVQMYTNAIRRESRLEDLIERVRKHPVFKPAPYPTIPGTHQDGVDFARKHVFEALEIENWRQPNFYGR